MEKSTRIYMRIPQRIVKQIQQAVRADHSSVSQFFRTAAVEKLDRDNKRVAA